MARTNKKGARTSKEQKQKTSLVKSQSTGESITVSSLSSGLDQGLLQPQVNPLGKTYHWFVHGRKTCRETGIKIDKDGFRYLKSFDQYIKVMSSGWQRSRMRRK